MTETETCVRHIERMGERNYRFELWDGEQKGQAKAFFCYGNALELVGTLDAILDKPEDSVVVISYDGYDLLKLDHPSGPDDYEIMDGARSLVKRERHAIENTILSGTSYWNRDTQELIFYQEYYDERERNGCDKPMFTHGYACWDDERGIIPAPDDGYDYMIAREEASLRVVTEKGWLSQLHPKTYECGPKLLRSYYQVLWHL